MAVSLKIINNFVLATQSGVSLTGKQGNATDAITDQFDFATTATITGLAHYCPGQLATATVVTIYDDDDDKPVDFNYLYFWADQDMYIQIIGSTGNAVFKVAAKVPFVLSHPGTVAGSQCGIVAVANTTPITGGTEPTLTDIDSIVLGNYSGTTANFIFAVID